MQAQENGREDSRIYITMFGGFGISAGGKSIQDTAMRTHQLWHLIEYLITYRHKTISQEELITVLWPDNDIDNPANALKNLVYRIRSTFSSRGISHAKEMIIYTRGGYQWNNSLDCVVDTEEFEKNYKLAMDENTPVDQRIDLCMKTLSLYSGDFLPSACYESWVIPIASYYHSLYFKCVYAVLELLVEKERYEETEMVCKRALIIDQFEENAHKYLMLALARQNKQTQALAHYSFVTDLFFRELGVSPSESMRTLYREIIKTVHNVEIDISIIQEDLRESAESNGAFYCEYEVFKNLYRLEARTAARTGQSMFISLLTVESSKEGEALEVKTQNKCMDGLFDVIQHSLRKGDVFSRFSASQYVLMLPTLTYENCEMVINRIVKRYKQTYRPKNVQIAAKVQPLDPVEFSRR